MRKNPAACK